MNSPMNDQESATMMAPNPSQHAMADTMHDHDDFNDHEFEQEHGSEPGQEAGQDKLNMIRDILVGDQIASLRNHFRSLENSHEMHYAKIGSDLMTKFESLKVLNKSEIHDLGKSVAEMVSRLQKEDSALSEEIRRCTMRINALEQHLDDMKQVLTEQVREMHEEFSTQMSEFSNLIKSQQDDVARQAVSRKDFAQILSGLAGSLAPEQSGHDDQE